MTSTQQAGTFFKSEWQILANELDLLNHILQQNKNQHRSARFFRKFTEVHRNLRVFLESWSSNKPLFEKNNKDSWLRLVQCNKIVLICKRNSSHAIMLLRQTYFMSFALVVLSIIARIFVTCKRILAQIINLPWTPALSGLDSHHMKRELAGYQSTIDNTTVPQVFQGTFHEWAISPVEPKVCQLSRLTTSQIPEPNKTQKVPTKRKAGVCNKEPRRGPKLTPTRNKAKSCMEDFGEVVERINDNNTDIQSDNFLENPLISNRIGHHDLKLCDRLPTHDVSNSLENASNSNAEPLDDDLLWLTGGDDHISCTAEKGKIKKQKKKKKKKKKKKNTTELNTPKLQADEAELQSMMNVLFREN